MDVEGQMIVATDRRKNLGEWISEQYDFAPDLEACVFSLGRPYG